MLYSVMDKLERRCRDDKGRGRKSKAATRNEMEKVQLREGMRLI